MFYLYITSNKAKTYASKAKDSITSKKPSYHDFWPISISVLNKCKSATPPIFNEVLSSASDKINLFPKNVSKNPNLDDLSISLPVLPSGINLKQENKSVPSRTVIKIITNLGSSKTYGPDCVPVIVLNTVSLNFHTY